MSNVLDISLGVTTLSFSVYARSIGGSRPPNLVVSFTDESEFTECVGFVATSVPFSSDGSISGYDYKAVITVFSTYPQYWPVGMDAHVYVNIFAYMDGAIDGPIVGVLDLMLVGLQNYFLPIDSGVLSRSSV
jgi:hypothetical protein